MSEESIVDAESYQGGGGHSDKINFQLIVLFHVQKCSTLGAVDHFYGGYWSHVEKVIAGGITSTDVYSYNESKGRAFENAVLTLYDLLSGNAGCELDVAFGDYENSISASIQSHNESIDKAREGKTDDQQWYMKQASLLCATRAKISRKLFRSCLYWLKKNNYLAGESYESGMDIELE